MTSHVVLATSLNLRTDPRVKSKKLGDFPLGTLVEELNANADRSWLRVRIGTVEGWMNNGYLLRTESYRARPWLPIAVREYGVEEVVGKFSNPRIDEYLTTVGASGDETSWCSAFAKWRVLQARASHPTKPDLKKVNAAARSWHLGSWGADVTATAPLASIVVLWRRRKATEPGFTEVDRSGTPEQVQAKGSGGHVGFLASPYRPGDTQISLLGGNQSNRVCKATYQLGHDYGLLSIRGY
jgi:uncharacterized protein (TIGR02594 family)